MKYAIIIADGGADKPIADLGGRTPFEAARTPNLDRLARLGRAGTAVTTPRSGGFEAGSDVCSMCLLGYDPVKYHTGRAPLEAAAMGLALGPEDWIFRMNFVTVGEEGTPDAGLMLDHSAGAISSEEGRVLCSALASELKRRFPTIASQFEMHPGVSYRNILIDRGSGGDVAARDYAALRTVPPHEIPRQRWADYVPKPSSPDIRARNGAEACFILSALAADVLPGHPINRARVAAGKRPANAVWIWGQGRKPAMPRFADTFGIARGGMITAVDLLAGIAALMGWERVDCPGISSYHDTDYAMQGRKTCEALDRLDIVCCHVESPDEASHQGDWKTKVAAVEAIDQHVVGPVWAHLERTHPDNWRMIVLPDHYTLVSTRKHDDTPVPWLMAGAGVRRVAGGAERFTEAECGRGERIEPGDRLMRVFLGRE